MLVLAVEPVISTAVAGSLVACVGHVGHVVRHVGGGCVAVLIRLPVGYSGWKFMYMQYLLPIWGRACYSMSPSF